MTSFSETRDGMWIDWDVPIEMDDGLVVRADVFRPVGEGRYPVILSYGPYAKGLAFQEGYPDQWDRMVVRAPRCCRGQFEPVSELGGGRPGEVGPGRVRLCAGRFAGYRPFTGVCGSFLTAGNPGFLRLYRMGWGPAVVVGQGGSERDLLLRHQSVAGGQPPAAPFGGDVRVGRGGRLVPGHDPSRWDPLHVLGQLV